MANDITQAFSEFMGSRMPGGFQFDSSQDLRDQLYRWKEQRTRRGRGRHRQPTTTPAPVQAPQAPSVPFAQYLQQRLQADFPQADAGNYYQQQPGGIMPWAWAANRG